MDKVFNKAPADRFVTYMEWCGKKKTSEGWQKLLKSHPIEARHRISLGGTSDAALLGMHPYFTSQDVWETMTSEDYTPADEPGIAMKIGIELEAVVAEWYDANISPVRPGETLTDITRPWSAAQIDAIDVKSGFGLEIKTTGSNRKNRYGVREWGKGMQDNDNTIPRHYYVQVQKQMLLLGTPAQYVACLFRDSAEIRVYRIERDEGMISRIIRAEDEFMFENVIPGVKPIVNFDELTVKGIYETQGLEASDGDALADKPVLKALAAYKDAKKKEKLYGDLASKLGAHISSRITHEGASRLILPSGHELAVLKSSTRKTFDSRTFKAQHPDTYEQFVKTTVTKPVLYVKD